MSNGTILSPAVTVMAATSRLIDLQHARGASVYVPENAPTAGIYTGIALLILESLHNLETERGTGYTTVTELFEFIRRSAADITFEDLEYVLLSLSKEREICFSIPDEKTGNLAFGHVRDKTKLVDLAESRGQVRITDTASLFLRICENELSWLYDEADAEKIIIALTHNKFKQIPTICRSISLELTKKARVLTDLIEHPTREEQGQIFIADGPAINKNLKNTKEIIQRALQSLLEQSTIDAFNRWSAIEKPDFELGNLHTELEILLQSAEAVTRRFIEFLDAAQQRKEVVPSHHQFLEIADHLVFNYKEGTLAHLDGIMRGVVPPSIRLWWFAPSLLPGLIDIYDLMDNQGEDLPAKSYDVSGTDSPAVKHFMDFIEKNRDAIYDRLSSGPLPFSEFLTSAGFKLGEGYSAFDFLGVYVSPHLLDGDGEHGRIIVGLPQNDFRQKGSDYLVISSDPVIILEK